MSLFDTGIRPLFDKIMLEKAEERRDYGDFWSASSAGYCYKKNILERLKTPYTTSKEDQARQQRVFQSGHLFHEFYQRITKEAGISIAQELEVIDDELMIKGHIDDLVLVQKDVVVSSTEFEMTAENPGMVGVKQFPHLILYDYKTRNSRGFNYAKQPMETHEMQLGTYMYMLRKAPTWDWQGEGHLASRPENFLEDLKNLTEARTLNIEKDTLRQAEVQYLYTDELEQKVLDYWNGLNKAWDDFQKTGKLPKCTCETFMKTERYNPFFYNDEPCSTAWLKKSMKEVSKKSETAQPKSIGLPTAYSKLNPEEKRNVRERYIELQKDKCFYCKETLYKEPPKRITDKKIDWELFPKGFLDYPIHLQHDHDTDMTEGAVHNYCNAVMWQYEKR